MSRYVRPSRREELRLFGAPSPEVVANTPVGRALAASARIHFTEQADQDRLIAVEKLALDVLHEPLSARAFAASPEEYMRRGGFSDVKLDLNSNEIRLAMAMGDPAVREAARHADVDGFINAVLAQGFEPSVGPYALFAVELGAYFSALAVSWVTVGYSIAAAVSLGTWIGVFGRAFLTAEHHDKMLAQIAESLGGSTFAGEVQTKGMERIIAAYVELHKEAESSLQG